MYLDSVMKEGRQISYYRDSLFKAVVRGMKSVEDSDYPVPAGLSQVLRGYQKTGFRWLKTLDEWGFGGILADDMGIGKTLQILALLEDEAKRSLRAAPGACRPWWSALLLWSTTGRARSSALFPA